MRKHKATIEARGIGLATRNTLMNYPNPQDLRAEAQRIETDAPAIADSSEYPRVAKFTCAGQVEALRNFAETIEQVGTVAPKRAGMTGEERRERRADILRLRAARLKVKASQHQRASHDIGCRIPFGQPILVGHHSERGHRRAIERMQNNSSKAYQLGNYADTLESRADSVEMHATINVSDSDAMEQYRAKLEKLTRERDNMKAINSAWRKNDRAKLNALGLDDSAITRLSEKIEVAYPWEKQPFPRWQISNLGAVIRDTEKKIARAQTIAVTPEREIESLNGIRLEDSPADNRVRLFFPGKPDEATRSTLKRNGFRWSPSIGCWQAFRNYHSNQIAESFVKP